MIPDLIFLTLFAFLTKSLLYFESITYLCPNSAVTTSFLCFHEQKKTYSDEFRYCFIFHLKTFAKWKRIKFQLLYEQVYVERSITYASFHNRNNNNKMSFSEFKEHYWTTVELRKTVNISGGNQCALQRQTS